MLSLRELQTQFRRAILGQSEISAGLRATLAEDPFADERIAIYRNNVLASLTAVLRDTFPVVCRLVDERFFAYAAQEFVCWRPPLRPALSEYGAAFPDFLAHFPPCRELVYFPDVARLEWLLNEIATAPDLPALSSDALAGVSPESAAALRFRLGSAYLESPWPVDRIWRANQPDAAEEAVDLSSGGASVEIFRHDGAVQFRPLPSAEFAFRKALSNSAALVQAIEQGLARGDFSPADALAQIFRDGLVVGII
jgi:hypothetical protein